MPAPTPRPPPQTQYSAPGSTCSLDSAQHAFGRKRSLCCRYQLPEDLDTVGDLMEHLVDRFQLSRPADGLQLSVDKYTLLSDAGLSIVREGDLMSVHAAAPALPSTASARGKRKTPADPTRPAKKRLTKAQTVLLALEAATAPNAAVQSEAAPATELPSSSDGSPDASGGCRSFDTTDLAACPF